MKLPVEARTAMLIQGSKYHERSLGVYNITPGQTTRVKLENNGILTSVYLYCTVTINPSVALTGLSPFFPFNFLSNILSKDFAGINRFNCNGWELFVQNAKRKPGSFFPFLHNSSNVKPAFYSQGLPVAAATGSATYEFILKLNYAYDEFNDLRGAIPMANAYNEMYLELTGGLSTLISAALTPYDILASGGTATLVTTTVEVVQKYLMPYVAVDAYPFEDFNIVHEFMGNIRSSDNLAVNSQKWINYPSDKMTICSYHTYVPGAVAATNTDISNVQLRDNGSNIVSDLKGKIFGMKMREFMDVDIGANTLVVPHLLQRVLPGEYGTFQLGITPNVVPANAFVASAYEMFYQVGTAMGGIPT